MTKEEIEKAAHLLEADEKEELESVRLGLWAAVSEHGIAGVFHAKREAIDDLLGRHLQSRDHCRIKRVRKGFYNVEILDADEDPIEQAYFSYTVQRITTENIIFFRELKLTELLPDWYFDPYSDEYREYFEAEE